MELLRPVEEVTVGGVYLMARSADISLDHTIHYGVEIADPGQLECLVAALRLHHEVPVTRHDGRLHTLAVEFGGDAEDDAEDTVAGSARICR